MLKTGLLAAVATAFAVAIVVVAPALGASSSSTSSGFKFAPTLNAPWAHGGEDETTDDPDPAAAGLCRLSLFTASTYTATSNVDVIVGDPLNLSGVSNYGR